MVILLTILETLAVVFWVLFNGILDSKYYEQLKMRTVSQYVYCPAYLLIAATFLTAMLDMYGWPWLEVVIFAHTVLHVVFAVLLVVAVIKFADLPFKYAKQYLLARAALYFAVVFEVLALGVFVVYCVKLF